MEIILSNPFAFLTLLAGILMIASGIVFKFIYPKRMTWYNTIQVKPAWNNSDTVWQKAWKWSAWPAILLGLLFLGAAILSLTFPTLPIFTISSASALIFVSCITTALLRIRYLEKLFDDERNEKGHA